MKLRAKILILLLGAIIPVMLFFAGLGTYFFNKILKNEAIKSHKLMYSLFLPTLSTYLWEFDTDGVRTTILNIMNNNYATDIYIYELDGSLILGYVRNEDNNNLVEVKDENMSEFMFSPKKFNNFNYQNNLYSKTNLIEIDNSKSKSTVVGVLSHKKIDGNLTDSIGYVVFSYSNKEIENLIAKSIASILIISFFVAGILAALISILLRKTLIEYIISLNNASIFIAMGRKETIKEKTGNDEISELIRNFNIMANQIDQNQENLKLIAEEGVKISSCLTIESMVKQIRESINKISNFEVTLDFYISSVMLDNAKKKGFIKINLINDCVNYDEKEVIRFGEENLIPPDSKRIFIRENVYGLVSAIIEIKNSKEEDYKHFKKDEKVYGTVQALQVSTASALSTMNFINEQKKQLRLVSEQETARLVQMNLLPTSELKKFSNFEIIGYFEPAAECAGDWWNTYLLPGNKLLILLGDVTGHGTGSALLTAVVKGYCDSLCQQADISTQEILSQLDKIVFNIGKGDRVMTMFTAILDPESNSIEFSNASQKFPFLMKKDGYKIIINKLISHGKPLGFKYSNYKNTNKFFHKMAKLEKNDLLFIFSDGLVEAINKDGVEFSDKNLRSILERTKDKSIVEIKEEILKELRDFIKDFPLTDDVTFVICKYVL